MLTLTFPINESLEGLHTGIAKHRTEEGKERARVRRRRKSRRKVVQTGTEAVILSGLVSFFLPSLPVQSVTRILSKLSG